MEWHRANRRKGRRLRLASVEPYLGDVVGAPLAPMRPIYRYEAPRWIERGVPVVLAWSAVAVYGALAFVALAMVFLTFDRVTPWWAVQ